MDEAQFEKRFGDLVQRIGELPEAERGRLHQLAAETRQRHAETRAAVAEARSGLARLDVTLRLLSLRLLSDT